jgi:hypothetical protein
MSCIWAREVKTTATHTTHTHPHHTLTHDPARPCPTPLPATHGSRCLCTIGAESAQSPIADVQPDCPMPFSFIYPTYASLLYT